MIRDFKREDLDLIDANEFGELELYRTMIDLVDFKTLTKDGEIMCILGYFKYWGDNYKSFLIISKKFDYIYARTARKLLYGLFNQLGACRIETESPDIPMLNRWHKFLGYEKEGTKVKFMENKDYNVWGMLCKEQC